MKIYCLDYNALIKKANCHYDKDWTECKFCEHRPFKNIRTSHITKTPKSIKSIPQSFSRDYIDICVEQFKEHDGHLYFLGLLAYPSAKEAKHLINFITSCISERFKAVAEAGYCKMSYIPERYRIYEKRKATRNIAHTLNRIADKRLKASIIAINRMGRFEPTLNKAVERFKSKSSKEIDRENIYHQIWSESKPVLHMAMAILPMIHNIYDKDVRHDLNVKKDLVGQIKKTMTFNITDLCIIPSNTAWRLNIKEESDLLKPGWLNDILNVAKVYYDLLPAMIPSIKQSNLIKLS